MVAVDVPGKHVLEVLTLRQHLTASEDRDCVGVREVQLEVHDAAVLKSLLEIVEDKVPNLGVQDMDCAKEIDGGLSLWSTRRNTIHFAKRKGDNVKA